MKWQCIAWWSSNVSKYLILAGNILRAYDSTLPWSDENKLCGIGCKTFWHMPNCFLVGQNIDRLGISGVLNIAIYLKTFQMFPYFAKQWFAWNTSSAKHCYIIKLAKCFLTLQNIDQLGTRRVQCAVKTAGNQRHSRALPPGQGADRTDWDRERKTSAKKALIFSHTQFLNLTKFYRPGISRTLV